MILTRRHLNRARLRRQWLSRRTDATVLDAIEHLVGLQAQSGEPPYYQLWSRLAGFRIDDLSAALTGGAAVRVVLMRGTIHLVSAADCARLRPVVQPYLDRTFFTGSQSGKRLVGVDVAELVAVGRALLADGPLTNDELAKRLGEHWTRYRGADLAYGLRCAAPLIQVPPRGVWGAGGALMYAAADQWLDMDTAVDASPDPVVLRYLAAFGPAGVADFQKWSGLTGQRAVFDRLRPDLVAHRDEDGRELFDVAGTEPPDPDGRLEPIMLGPFDNLLLSHADRTFIIDKAAGRRVFTQNGMVKGTFLIDGFVAGSWRVDRKRRLATVTFEPFTSISGRDREALAAEGARLLSFAAADSDRHHVEFADA